MLVASGTGCAIMAAMLSDPMPQVQERPRGVVAIVAVCALLSAISFVFVALLLAGRIPLSAGAIVLGGGMEQLGPLAFLLYGAIVGVLGAALWQRCKGVRRVAIVLAVAGTALAIPAISSAVVDERIFAMVRDGLQIVVRVLVIFYLTQEPVKEWFTSR